MGVCWTLREVSFPDSSSSILTFAKNVPMTSAVPGSSHLNTPTHLLYQCLLNSLQQLPAPNFFLDLQISPKFDTSHFPKNNLCFFQASLSTYVYVHLYSHFPICLHWKCLLLIINLNSIRHSRLHHDNSWIIPVLMAITIITATL